MADRDQYLLRALVTAQRERKMALKTRDAGLIKSAETRLAVAWKNAVDHVNATTRAAVLSGNAGVPEVPAPQPTPYGLAGIEGDAIVIRLTADACAFAFANDPQAQEPRPPVIDKQQFLRDTLNELTSEREDGSTPLTDMLDRAMVKAMENGSDALDHDAADGVKGSE